MSPTSSKYALLLPLLGLVPVATAWPEEEEEDAPKQGMDQVATIGRELQKLGDWEDQFDLIEPSIDRFWEENDWSEESDLFARDTFREVASIPPWEFTRRINHLTGAVRDRYDMNDDQFSDMQMRMYGMIGSVALMHGGTIMRQTKEAVQTRLQGRPFSPKQVARWTRESEHLLRQARMQFEQIADDMSESFTPAQREILERDMKSYHRRAKVFNDMRARWIRGKWRPEDWGLQDDPIHRRVMELADDRPGGVRADSARARALRKGKAVPRRPLYEPHDETSWERYVRQFIARHDLDEAQATSALSILRELQERARVYRRGHREELAAVPPDKLTTAEVYQPITRIFEELQRRLRPIPTDAQRRRAVEIAGKQSKPNSS